MKPERSSVEFLLWRKKVDASLFERQRTTIPNWACKMWDIPHLFQHCTVKSHPDAKVEIQFKGNHYPGFVTIADKGRSTPAYQLWFDDMLCLELKREFLMSYMRSLEKNLNPNPTVDIEIQIPFWEFLDIEFDKTAKEFRFVAYYQQEPSFPHLFARLIGSPAIQKINDELARKDTPRIHTQKWKPRKELDYELGAANVIYMLVDSKSKLLYIGEASDLVKRLTQDHPSIPKWDYFRYEVLPTSLADYRELLERMLIRDLAFVMPNKRDVKFISISDFKLANDKIDHKKTEH